MLELAKTKGLSFDIYGYQDSEGKTHNYRGLTFGGHKGYLGLVQESITWALRRNTTVPGWCGSVADWHEAVTKQLASWQKTLDGGHDRKQKELLVGGDGSWALDEARPELLILKNLIINGEHSLVDANHMEIKEAKSMVAQCTAFLRAQAPLNKFVGQLNLAPGKFSGMVIHSPGEPAESKDD